MRSTPAVQLRGIHYVISTAGFERPNIVLVVMLAVAIIRGFLYAGLIPPFAAPDESGHFDYVAYLATNGASGPKGSEQYQPAPYYALMVPAYWLTSGLPPENQVLLMRLFALPLMLGVVALTWMAGRRMAPSSPLVASLATATVALHPQLAAIGASINNDNAVNLAGALIAFFTVCLFTIDGPWVAPLLLIVLAASVLTKGQILAQVFFLLVVVATVSLWRHFRASSEHTRTVGVLVLAAVLGVLGVAVILGTQQRTQLAFVLLARDKLSVLSDWTTVIAVVSKTGLDPLVYQFSGFWALFINDSVGPPSLLYCIPLFVLCASLAGYLLNARVSLQGNVKRWLPSICLRTTLMLMIVATWAQVYIAFMKSRADAVWWGNSSLQGRYLLVALVPLALLTAEGLSMLSRGRASVLVLIVLISILAIFDLSSIAALVYFYRWPAG